MDRRGFLTAVGACSMAAGWGNLVAASERRFDPTNESMASLLRGLNAGDLTSEHLTAAYLHRIDLFDRQGPAFRSVLSLNPAARAAARALDIERRANRLRGPLHGLPILIKDNIETRDPMPTTAGSLALALSRRVDDAPVVARLRAAGALILGKTNLSEWANYRSTHAISGWSATGGQTRNAYARDRNPSGSSAGSAVAAALSFCAGAVGSETNGSILSPASVNGLVGLKPTVGLIAGRGIVPISPRQDTAGPLCRSVTDAALLVTVMAERELGYGRRARDLESFRLQGVRVGVMPIPSGAHPGVARVFAEARAAMEGEGAQLVDLEEPAAFDELDAAESLALSYEFKSAINLYLATLDPAQVSCRTLSALIEFNQANANSELPLFGQELFERAESRGPLTDSAYLASAATLSRAADTDGLSRLLDHSVSVLMAPSHGPAELIDSVWGDRRGGSSPRIGSAAAIAGFPSMTVPAGLIDTLPVGLTLVGKRDEDGLLLQVARAFERATHARVAPRLARLMT